MRAWQVTKNGEPDKVLDLVDIGRPEPGPGEVLIRVKAASLSLPDVFMCRGIYPLQPEKLPYILGQEIAGVVVETGEGAPHPVGARVMGPTLFPEGKGGFAEYVCCPGDRVFAIPDELGWENAATVYMALGTAYVCVIQRGKVKAGETVLVHGGAGGVGAAIIQLAKHLGARVIATEVGDKKVDACKNLGADIAIDALSDDFVQVVNEATKGTGADVTFDSVGGKVFENSFACMANEGRIVLIGYASGKWFDASSHSVIINNISLVGAFLGAYDRKQLLPMYDYMTDLLVNGHLASTIERVISFEQIPEGLADTGSHKAVGRIVAKF